MTQQENTQLKLLALDNAIKMGKLVAISYIAELKETPEFPTITIAKEIHSWLIEESAVSPIVKIV